MSAYDYPHTGYGVEAHTDATGWVLLNSIYRNCVAATKLKQSLTGPYGFEADDLRVVALTISRKEDDNDNE